ncbi:hypothetical protein [Mycolicibacterium brumae]|uniref:hypothetical protein n=1 Tax=Mycolicibacterium brumae TaxID=85968 RepID=UPI000FE1B99A|nr:hypothetical protein [Mycolicibacterium brumae]MCV7191437.1 hypothetical protein [Mycolicibacterium brumae]UWW09455.1 hypothetical protein L2Z93_002556 [Mycolicibacterium brumae]
MRSSTTPDQTTPAPEAAPAARSVPAAALMALALVLLLAGAVAGAVGHPDLGAATVSLAVLGLSAGALWWAIVSTRPGGSGSVAHRR